MPEFPCTGPVPVKVRVAAGSVEIFAEQRDTAVVHVTEAGGDRESARTLITFDAGVLTVAAPEPTGWLLRRGYRVHAVIRVPVGSDVSIKTASADVRCTGRYAGATIGTASGDVYVEAVDGDLDVTTASGDIRAERVGGAARTNSASGSVTLGTAGGEITAHTASGAVRVGDAAASLHAVTASGDVTIGTARAGTLRIRTISGDTEIGVAAGTGVWLDLGSVSGRTRNDLSMSGDAPASGASLTVAVQSVSGDIHLYRSAGTARADGDSGQPVRRRTS